MNSVPMREATMAVATTSAAARHGDQPRVADGEVQQRNVGAPRQPHEPVLVLGDAAGDE